MGIVIKLKLLSALFLLSGMAACTACPEEMFREVGEYTSREEALKAAIPKLAETIRECPHVNTYRIFFVAPGEEHRVDRHALLYFRLNGTSKIGYEDDPYSGITPSYGPYEIDDAMIQTIAEQGGNFEEFKRHDRQRNSSEANNE